MQLMLVFIGGGVGSVLRYLIGICFRNVLTPLPLATLAANVSACLLLALFVKLSATPRFFTDEQTRLFVITGLCGGLSTFSTFSYETVLMMRDGMVVAGVLNVVVSVVLCTLIFLTIK